jgi:predicted NACHT family NTPase
MQLMKQQIDALVAKDPYLQEFLSWASQKSQTIPSPPKLATGRAFYLALARTPHVSSHFILATSLDQGMFLDAALDGLLVDCAIGQSQSFAHAHACCDALNNILGIVLDAGFQKALQQLKDQLPNLAQDQCQWQAWWRTHHAAWSEQLQITITDYRHMHHRWQFSPEQEQTLQRYYDANQLLLDCLHSNGEITGTIRQEIEATLLLPQQELEAREWA